MCGGGCCRLQSPTPEDRSSLPGCRLMAGPGRFRKRPDRFFALHPSKGSSRDIEAGRGALVPRCIEAHVCLYANRTRRPGGESRSRYGKLAPDPPDALSRAGQARRSPGVLGSEAATSGVTGENQFRNLRVMPAPEIRDGSVWVRDTAYPLRNIAAVQIAGAKAGALPKLLIFSGMALFMFLGGISKSISTDAELAAEVTRPYAFGALGLVILGVVAALWRRRKSEVLIQTNAGFVTVLSTPDRSSARDTLGKITRAIDTLNR